MSINHWALASPSLLPSPVIFSKGILILNLPLTWDKVIGSGNKFKVIDYDIIDYKLVEYKVDVEYKLVDYNFVDKKVIY